MMRIETLIPGKRWAVNAPAKVNLFFEILGKRPDGYHEIETVAATISLFDRLEFERTNGGLTLACYNADAKLDPEIPCDERNLVAKAVRAFCDAVKIEYDSIGISCNLYKHIPAQAGLGGGSSDAAATLAVLDLAFGTELSKNKLQEIAAKVGSDCPLFLENGASVGRGRGEVVEPVALPELWLVILKPVEGLSTPAVYKRYAEATHDEKRSLRDFCSRIERARECLEASAAAEIIARGLSNRLEDPAEELWNGLKLRRALFANTDPKPLAVQMSGSGTAVFAIYKCEGEAREAALRLQAECADRVYVAKTL